MVSCTPLAWRRPLSEAAVSLQPRRTSAAEAPSCRELRPETTTKSTPTTSNKRGCHPIRCPPRRDTPGLDSDKSYEKPSRRLINVASYRSSSRQAKGQNHSQEKSTDQKNANHDLRRFFVHLPWGPSDEPKTCETTISMRGWPQPPSPCRAL